MTDATTIATPFGVRRPKRLLVLAIMAALAIAPGQLGELTRELMTDAYVQVSVFVAATLLLFYGAERLFKFDIGEVLSNAKGAQVPLAALLGATPGCGGAVVVVAAYSSGHVGFGAVVATLTATMGDAAFLLLATRPDAAAVVLPLSFAIGILSGWIVDRFHTVEYRASTLASCELAPLIGKTRPQDVTYLLLAIPGLYVGALQLAQIEVGHIFGLPIMWIALVGTFLGLTIWATSKVTAMTNAKDSPLTRMAEETSFISVWVIGAYLAYDYVAEFGGLDLELLFQSIGPLLPLMGVLVGLIPGCGPQVLVTTLYLNGIIPFAALMGNAVSNDGDALFPAIALNPKAAIYATLYSTIPAMIIAYAFYIFAPGFMN
ncbi:putative manganese transporter [Aliiroseovarius marinus]|uniref:putative manganese transporter n=1 Tax=Aliiroseovarius marinus TaxID=2500159 RepID=UPI00249513F9|nr:putative manganese transporter [Aliiroseovarius marinus]